MSVPYGVLIGVLGEYADEYLLPLFNAAGYHVLVARGSAALFDIINRQIELALIDLPGYSHLDLLAELRAQYTGTLLILGPRLDRLVVTAFAHGIDDYVVRPFRADELMARVRAQLRRRQRYAPPPFTIDRFVFDLSARTISYDGHLLELDLPAFTLLCVLADSPYRVFTAQELLALVWGRSQIHSRQLLGETWQALRQQIGSEHSAHVLVGDPTCGVALLKA